MESINFGYSMENTPIGSKTQSKYKIAEKFKLVLKEMRWKVYFFDINSTQNNSNNNSITVIAAAATTKTTIKMYKISKRLN